MRFWDSSALVPLLVKESASETMARIYGEDRVVVVAWTTAIECLSACVQKQRAGQLTHSHLASFLDRLRDLRAGWVVAEPSVELAADAERLVARHGLRSGDAIQLASAVVTGGQGADRGSIVCLDRRLAQAALAEGFRTIPDLR